MLNALTTLAPQSSASLNTSNISDTFIYRQLPNFFVGDAMAKTNVHIKTFLIKTEDKNINGNGSCYHSY